MKTSKNILYTVIILVVFTFTVVFVSKIFMKSRYLSDEEAKEIVFLNSNSNEKDVSEYKCVTEINDDGKLVYKISFVDSKGVYRFLLDCESGKIIEFTELLNTNSDPKSDIQ